MTLLQNDNNLTIMLMVEITNNNRVSLRQSKLVSMRRVANSGATVRNEEDVEAEAGAADAVEEKGIGRVRMGVDEGDGGGEDVGEDGGRDRCGRGGTGGGVLL